ncbi:expressed unknown protein [Seminavis robusta]|uniref:HD domain-containing protein n=1 Tax=Seminavis robusta TaxID=568900 RepID=A0A9N8E5H4_9STRA|nr:expressed unknown protein [Seminavis robusta]|eukprot:Sro562_g166970.1 n/a (235) ;mRNA; r:13899-14603
MRCPCNIGGRPDISLSWFERLCRHHSESQRHYHTLMHLEEIFLYLDMLLQQQTPKKRTSDEETLVLATFFHDAIYNVHSSTNEEDSAALFQTFVKELQLGGVTTIANGLEDSVVDLILATKQHQVSTENSPLLSLFLDLDMAVLGKEQNAYLRYAALIRNEYQHVPHAVYCEKRVEVLETFLEQPQIFGTQVMEEAFEQRARDNLQAEIESLKRGEILTGRSSSNNAATDKEER